MWKSEDEREDRLTRMFEAQYYRHILYFTLNMICITLNKLESTKRNMGWQNNSNNSETLVDSIFTIC